MSRPLILVIEDNAAVSRVVEEVLRSFGCDPRVENDGRQALRRLRAEPPALVLVDMRLPGMDGLEIVREIRKTRGLEALPVIGVTGYAHAIHAKDAIAAGCNAFLEKPFDLAELRRTIESFVTLDAESPR
ncbi:MAG: response regulator [Acidobacteria bacterium]|nr:response regulator [Acidobacteriota bacterium]